MSLTLTLDFQYKTSTEKLWSALTDSSKLAKWVANIHTGQAMDNDFKPVVGHRFQFRTQPTEWWNGIIDGEVLIVDAPNQVSYTWVSGGEKHTVTWTLQDLGDGKVNLHLEQTGISNDQALAGAKYGWGKWCGELEKVLEQ
ncbi:SRPBCC domain-containing protein [Paenibacillus frigoriresistens]|uniref:SRPBCC family protein n=1 Tax=Paenibacillus alginolyticus TaxID=59839 RepID=UPI001564A1C3|nr:SRPBCC domain-containing protein [Paenibacillus frigoriresistens]NRF94080.1 SRPBCC domain-containing protein [Paenibacillus frigoriresistens]